MEIRKEAGECVYFRYFGGSWNFALMIVPKREKKILLSHYIPSFCSLLQVAFIFSVPSYSPPWCEGLYFPWVSVGFPMKKAIFPFVSTFFSKFCALSCAKNDLWPN